MNEREFRRKIRERCLLYGQFKLRSGKISDRYFDKYRFESEPELLREVARRMAALLPEGVQRLAGLEMGGIPLATAVSLETGLPVMFVRKKAKEYGTKNVVEGLYHDGQKVVVIEDVLTTGTQAVNAARSLEGLGLTVLKIVCLIDREEGAREVLTAAGFAFDPLITRTMMGL